MSDWLKLWDGHQQKLLEIGMVYPRSKRIKDRWYDRYLRALLDAGLITVSFGMKFCTCRLTDAGKEMILTAEQPKYMLIPPLNMVKEHLREIGT